MEKSTKEKYTEAVGRRKEAVARVRITRAKTNKFIINKKDFNSYFPTEYLKHIATEPISRTKLPNKYNVSVKVYGGGMSSQAEASRLGISRALVKDDPDIKFNLKKFGYLTRDARIVERKKFGKKKARKSPQWSKR